VRIIGGHLGGRRLPIPDYPGLRPTGERVRETLFNWLQPVITGSRCLDAFAGSGALGFEALSRGASQVVMLEHQAAVVRQLRANAKTLDLSGLEIVHQDALAWLVSAEPDHFDLVFLDPPFAAGDALLAPTLRHLSTRGWLGSAARVYIETDVRAPRPALPANWDWWREKIAGQVRFGLAAPGAGSTPILRGTTADC
jgi:16S rRNA (guanine966-N2)-methyltransferase